MLMFDFGSAYIGDYIKVLTVSGAQYEGYIEDIALSLAKPDARVTIINFKIELGYEVSFNLSDAEKISIIHHSIQKGYHPGDVELIPENIIRAIKKIPTSEETFADVLGIGFDKYQEYMRRKLVPFSIAHAFADALDVPMEKIIRLPEGGFKEYLGN